MVDLSWLPGVGYWGARRVDRVVRVDTAAGALLGVLLAPPLLFGARALEATLRVLYGWPWGLVGWLLGWVVGGYLALLGLANWRDLDADADGDGE